MVYSMVLNQNLTFKNINSEIKKETLGLVIPKTNIMETKGTKTVTLKPREGHLYNAMPKPGYTTITIRQEVRDQLIEAIHQAGYKSLNQFLLDLLRTVPQKTKNRSPIEPRAGFEPATCGLRGRRSTAELPGRFLLIWFCGVA